MNAFAKVDKATFLSFAAEHPEQRYEYVGGRIVQQMTGGTLAHGLVTRRITRMLEDQLDVERWTVVNDRGVETPTTIRYPEIVVARTGEELSSLATSAPALIVEVLSPSTTVTDLDVNPGEYLGLTSLEAYIIASQAEPAILIYERGKGGRFRPRPREVSGFGTLTVEGRQLAISLDLAAVYRGIA